MSIDDILGELKSGYLASLPGSLLEMENLALALESNDNFQENYNALYRRAHSLKGSGGTYGFSIISSVCHQLEDFLSASMSSPASVSQQKIDILFAYIDLLKDVHAQLSFDESNISGLEQRLQELKHQDSPNRAKAIFIGHKENVYSQICIKILEECNIDCAVVDSGITALQRLLHEHFDLLVTSRENSDLSGIALIAALRLNRRKNSTITTILTTSNEKLDTPAKLTPDHIVLKNQQFSENLSRIAKSIVADFNRA